MPSILRRAIATALVLALAACSAGCFGVEPQGTPSSGGAQSPGRGGLPSAPEDLKWSAPAPSGAAPDLPVQRVSEVGPSRLAEGLEPPTNRWFSGLVFGEEPQTVHPYPLAFRLTGSGFAFDLPGVVATADTIAAPFDGGIAVDVGATSATVIRYDSVSVTLRLSDAAGAIGDITAAEGWPVIAFTASRAVALSSDHVPAPIAPGVWTTAADDVVYGVSAPRAELAHGSLMLPAGASAQWWPVPAGAPAVEWAEAIGTPVTAVETGYALSDAAAFTRLRYEGADTTIVVPLPGREPERGCTAAAYATAYGAAAACTGTTLAWSTPRLTPRASFDLAGIDAAAHAEIRDQLADDLSSFETAPADTYFGGKALARLASLLLLARSLGADASADRAAAMLERELAPWLEPDGCLTRHERCFAYDDGLDLVVGRVPSFGSEEGNDHHFHYGYFLLSAVALSAADPEAVPRLAPVMDALTADIAGGAPDALPAIRMFDPYRGHSWASGTAPFADGNNQESTSEAVAAWNAVALWATVRGDDELRARAEWMLSAEAEAARALWLEPADLPSAYLHGMVSLTWGGKRDYATWFSAEPSAILGIQLLPVGPVGLQYLGQDPARVAANVSEAGGGQAFDGELGEFVLLYSALAGPDALSRADELVRALGPGDLDDGLAKSVALAWIEAVRLGQAEDPPPT